jgi:protein-tyrosine kinase
MERIRDAIERAKKGRDKLPVHEHGKLKSSPLGNASLRPGEARPAAAQTLTTLDRHHLQDNRILAFDGIDRRSAHYDMLRTQVLQILDEAGIKTMAVTSPRASCGKTVTAINLAFSIARQHEQSVLLVDLDLRKPVIARYLGIRPEHGIDDVAEGRCRLNEAVIRPDVGQGRLSVLAPAAPVASPAELIVSSQMKALTERLKSDKRFTIIIYDLPPMLSSDDFLAFLPQTECAMLIAAVGETTVQEIAECERLIGEDKFLGCVLNKAAQGEAGYAYYS